MFLIQRKLYGTPNFSVKRISIHTINFQAVKYRSQITVLINHDKGKGCHTESLCRSECKKRTQMLSWSWCHPSLNKSKSQVSLIYSYPSTYTLFLFPDVLRDAFSTCGKRKYHSVICITILVLIYKLSPLHSFVQQIF